MPVENGEHGNWLCSEMKHTDGILLSAPCYLSVMYTDVFWDTFRRFTHACSPQLLRWKLHKPRGWKTTQEKLNITVSDMCDHPKCLLAVRCAPFRLWNVPILRMKQDSHTMRCGLTSIKHRSKKRAMYLMDCPVYRAHKLQWKTRRRMEYRSVVERVLAWSWFSSSITYTHTQRSGLWWLMLVSQNSEAEARGLLWMK